MSERIIRKQSEGMSVSLNLLLWFAFSVFALILVVIFMVVQSLLVGAQYRQQTIELMRNASSEMSAILEGTDDAASIGVWREMRAIEEEYDVNMRFLYTDGRSVFADADESFPEIAEALKNSLNAGNNDVVLREESTIAYATVVNTGGQIYFLYVSGSLLRLNTLERSLRLLSIATAIVSIGLAFIMSGFVAMLITKPVTAVTEQAKELARGNYELNLRRDYFCSEISELSGALDYARVEISKADSMQKELIANVSHDFRTPLTMIKAYASMIREISGENKEKRDAHAQIIIDEADRLSALVEDVLDLSKLRSDVGMQAPTVFNLSELVYMITDRFDYLKVTDGYVFECTVEEDLYAYADRERIEQVVYNLIGNAVNYTGEDKTVRIRLISKENCSRIEVEDTGSGISEEDKNTIWERYYRSKETHKRPVKGTGLGLSIVKNILIKQGCPFGVESELGKGSTFWVEFPSPPEDVQGGK